MTGSTKGSSTATSTATSTAGRRILVMAHGHPDHSFGGAEIAAYELWRGYRETPGVAVAWFLARSEAGPAGASGRILRHRPDEYLWEQGMRNLFMMEAENRPAVLDIFAEVIASLRPDVVHSHHFVQFGLEYLKVIKDVNPAIRTVLTLHEYYAICAHSGLMLDPGTLRPCSIAIASKGGHRACAPGRSDNDHWLRRQRFLRYFDFVDHFVAPSHFLRDAYVAWGLDPARISVIENGQPRRSPLPPRPIPADARKGYRNRFAFFGQINPWKGLDVVLEGLGQLAASDRAGLLLEVHGANLERQPEAFRNRLKALAAPLIDEGVVRWIGPYAPEDLADRMAGIDWVMVPSIWYENSPLVIQEAYALGRPVIASRHGALVEKVQDGVTGVTVPRANPMAWAEAMLRLSRDGALWDRLRQGLPTPPDRVAAAATHLARIDALEPTPA